MGRLLTPRMTNRLFIPLPRPRGSRIIHPLARANVRESLPMLRTVTHHLVRFVKAEDGPTAVEYAVMLALIIVVCIGAITSLGGSAKTTFQNVANTLPSGS